MKINQKIDLISYNLIHARATSERVYEKTIVFANLVKHIFEQHKIVKKNSARLKISVFIIQFIKARFLNFIILPLNTMQVGLPKINYLYFYKIIN